MRDNQQWIWQDKNYPHFEYGSKKISTLIESISMKQGELRAFSKILGKESLEQSQLNALENEIISSSAIEGEILDRDSVKSSIKEKLGIEVPQYYKEKTKESNYVDVLIDANTNYKQNLTVEKLFSWHYKMFENYNSKIWNIEIGTFRNTGTMQVVSGVIGKQKVFYEAPNSTVVNEEMNSYIKWFNETPASLSKVCIAHLWFVIIHPFDDGNGRITRAITDMVLSAIENTNTSRLYSMSKSINSDRKGYYKALEKTTGYIKKDNLIDITFWCEWFLKMLEKSLIEAIASIVYVVDKAKFWDKHRNNPINERQTKVLNSILDKGMENFEGGLSTKKYIKITGTTSATASRDIKSLVKMGCIKQVDGSSGRSVRYEVLV
ncbi:MAG: Filamentation induced by cAMP protein Fic [uncultured Sulfurovum sp.]|uniref:Filamentation induced by cAMP protein Fic n=1 Tax=uncultured Sulfurovum sp. TaxID=269237 RepID=A0A6S6TCK7_9BACT|nr:MAG: Filamentation induced by cAMP protein Fic [uncultured Sulfurovum sp.]